MTAARSSPPDGASFSFEEAYTRLEQTVQRLETGGLSLDEALALYEEGMRLAGLCTGLLDTAELRISQVAALPDRDLALDDDPDLDLDSQADADFEEPEL